MKSLPVPMSLMILLRFSPRCFIVLGFTFKFLIHLELIFIYGIRKGSSFSLLHVARQFFQHHLLNRKSFLYCLIFFKDQIVVDMQPHFWVIYLVPLVYVTLYKYYDIFVAISL